ncbi:hypothetical protein LCGC14_1604210 [marine sediment metagenome]|uniref:Uncharacterized protein n=1 Tax=marine sediment metagenome TaxID=412755 RepID=A0A0F9IWW4_9ZZZZ
MVLEHKPPVSPQLKETYVLVAEASTLWYAVELYRMSGEDMPEHLVEMLEKRLDSALVSISELVHPHPF